MDHTDLNHDMLNPNEMQNDHEAFMPNDDLMHDAMNDVELIDSQINLMDQVDDVNIDIQHQNDTSHANHLDIVQQNKGKDEVKKKTQVLAINYRTFKVPKPKNNDLSLAKVKSAYSFVNDVDQKYVFNAESNEQNFQLNSEYITNYFDLNNINKTVIKIDLNVEPNKGSLIKVFSTKNKEPSSTKNKDIDGVNASSDKKSQDMIETNVESQSEYDSTLNINIKKEVDILKLLKTEDQGELDI